MDGRRPRLGPVMLFVSCYYLFPTGIGFSHGEELALLGFKEGGKCSLEGGGGGSDIP